MKTALYGVWHVHAWDYIKDAIALSEVVGVYDDNKEMLDEFCKHFSLPAFSSAEELLTSDADGVIVCTSTDIHPEVMISIANAGKHIFTEKVLALTDEDCDRIEEAVSANNINFVISLPKKPEASYQTIKKVVDSGELGEINYLRYRNCHAGSIAGWLPAHFFSAKQCGGGAMIDLGAHGMYLTDWLLGMPTAFKSVFTTACHTPDNLAKNTDKVEDNAVTVMSYPNGCIAINETGFVSNHYPPSLELGGDKGYVRMEGRRVVKATTATNGETVEVPLEKELPSPIEQFLTGEILDGYGMKEAKHLTHMMVEAYK